MRHLSLATAVLLVASSATLHAQTTSTIVWSHDGEIWRMDDDGGNPTQLSDPGAGEEDRRPSICERTNKVAFDRTSNGVTEIWIMDPDGSDETNLSAVAEIEGEDPACGAPHPEGDSYIVFRSEADEATGELYRMELDGTDVQRLTNNAHIDQDPAWCEDRILFARKIGTDEFEIYQMDEEGNDQVEAFNNDSDLDVIQPSCRSIRTTAHSRVLGGNGLDIYSKNLDNNDPPVQQTGSPGSCSGDGIVFYSKDRYTSWSPGSTQIVFELEPLLLADSEIFKISLGDYEDNSDCMESLEQLTSNSVEDREPEWGELTTP